MTEWKATRARIARARRFLRARLEFDAARLRGRVSVDAREAERRVEMAVDPQPSRHISCISRGDCRLFAFHRWGIVEVATPGIPANKLFNVLSQEGSPISAYTARYWSPMPARRCSNFVKFGWPVFEGDRAGIYLSEFLVSQRWPAGSREGFLETGVSFIFLKNGIRAMVRKWARSPLPASLRGEVG
jgi:hypothetical protein